MSLIAQAMRSLFPYETPRAPRRRAQSASRLSQGLSVACALVPLGAMIHAFSQSV